MRFIELMECLFGCLHRKKIKLLLLIIIFVAGYYLIFNSHSINFFNKFNELQKSWNENASLFHFDVEYNRPGLLLGLSRSRPKINKNSIDLPTLFENKNSYSTKSFINGELRINNNLDYKKNYEKIEIDNDLTTSDSSNHSEIRNENNASTAIINEEYEVLKTEEIKSINDAKSREEIMARRKSRIAEDCLKLQIIPDDLSGGVWGRSECHPTTSENGYKECINPKHFPLARSSSSMTCIINKVASTSVAVLFLKNDGQVSPTLNDISPHEIVSSITATRKEEFLFAKKHFFKFLIVRDPFERLLSAYVDKLVIADHWSLLDLRADILKFIVEHKGYLSNKFVKVDSKLATKNGDETQNVESASQDSYVPSFQEFLEYILSSNLEGDGFESHWVPYWKWCAPCSMQYDFIAKLDSSPSDLEFIWNRMGIHDQKSVPWLNKSVKKRQELEELKALHYSLLSLKTIAEIYRKFFLDFKLFDYDIRDVLMKGNHCTKGNCENIMQTHFYR